MFEELRTILSNKNFGTEAHKQFMEQCGSFTGRDSKNAAFLFVLSIVAQRFIWQYDEWSITEEEIEVHKNKMLDYLARFEKASDESPDKQIALLNDICQTLI